MSDESAEKIEDLPSYKELDETASGVGLVASLWPTLRAVGLVEEDLPFSKVDVAQLRRQTQELLGLPDRFNRAFSSQGWIAYETLNVDLIRKAVELAEGGSLAKGEETLLDYYLSEDNIRFHLRLMMGVNAWRPREPLGVLALEDYLAGRYHACVPLVLALMDGLVSDVATTGFFAGGTDVTAWDSVAGHSSGLAALCGIFSRGRRKTTAEELELPYRHGILHGRDLGFANSVVAAKTWAALFAVRDWASKIESGSGQAPEAEEPANRPKTFLGSLRELRDEVEKLGDIRKDRRRLDEWRARPSPADLARAEPFLEGTPEASAKEVLSLWSAGNYGGIARLLSSLSGDESVGKRAGRIRTKIEPKRIEEYEILEIQDEAAAVTAVVVEVAGQASFAISRERYCFSLRMIYEDSDGNAEIRSKEDGRWLVVEISLYTPRQKKNLLKS
ncbi:MAG: hypothetical protein AAGN66_09435 [Acidobacteriota bacterium]